MKCEICHQADAAAVIHVKKDGEEKELYVCKACATRAKHSQKRKRKAESQPELSFGDGEEPPEFVKNLVEATLGFMKGVAESAHDKIAKCPVCKSTWDHIKDSGRIGCPACWKVFAKRIRDPFLSGEYGPKHAGAMPATVTGEASRAYLERELKSAVAREDFKRAAALKRLIDELGDKEKDA